MELTITYTRDIREFKLYNANVGGSLHIRSSNPSIANPLPKSEPISNLLIDKIHREFKERGYNDTDELTYIYLLLLPYRLEDRITHEQLLEKCSVLLDGDSITTYV